MLCAIPQAVKQVSAYQENCSDPVFPLQLPPGYLHKTRHETPIWLNILFCFYYMSPSIQQPFMDMMRIFRHLMTGQSTVKRAFPPATLTVIEQAIAQSETTHAGEIVFAVEASLDLSRLIKNQSVRDRAIDVFSLLRVWDTEYNNGMLIYVLLADHNIEIVADRGIHTKVDQATWEIICHTMKNAFSHKQFEQGVLAGIEQLTQILQEHFPAGTNKKGNTLPDKPVVL